MSSDSFIMIIMGKWLLLCGALRIANDINEKRLVEQRERSIFVRILCEKQWLGLTSLKMHKPVCSIFSSKLPPLLLVTEPHKVFHQLKSSIASNGKLKEDVMLLTSLIEMF